MKIYLFYGTQPCLDITICKDEEPNYNVKYGVNRDRDPDSGWGQMRSTILSSAKEVELIPELKITLLQDLVFYYGSDSKKFTEKLKEFEII